MTRRIVSLSLLAVLTMAVFACVPRWHGAEVQTGGVTVRMELRPMAGLHSDWHRRLVVTTATSREVHDLFPDTGWWRGSALYLSDAGDLIQHEGQLGCSVIHKARGSGQETISCVRSAPTSEVVASSPPPSRHYPGLRYLGMFVEMRDGSALRWQGWQAGPEPDLPDPL